MVGIIFITDMIGIFYWILTVIAIFLLLKGYCDYKYFIACYKGLIFSVKWIWQFLLGRWKWLRSLPKLKQAYVIIAGLVGAALLFLFGRLYLELFLFEWKDPKIANNSIRDLAIAFFGTISGIGALFGVYLAILRSEENTRQNEIANDQNEITEQGLITDRISNATDGLGKSDEHGKPILEVRLGSLYALERIAQDSIRDHVQIMEMLCAYIRTNRPLSTDPDKVIPISEDIQAALNIIGRRENWTKDKEHLKKEREQKYNLDLRKCDLQGAQLDKASLDGTNFDGTDLRKAQLNRAQLHGANLNNTDLREAQLEKADISRAKLEDVDLSGAKLSNANMTHIRIIRAKLINARLYSADMSDSRISRSDLSRASFHRTILINTRIYNTDMSHAGFTRTKLNNATLEFVNLNYARFRYTDMSFTHIEETHAYKCNFLECNDLTQNQIEAMFCGIGTVIPNNLTRPGHWPTDNLTFEEFIEANKKWREARWSRFYPK